MGCKKLEDKLCVRTISGSEKYLYLLLKDNENLVGSKELNIVSIVEMNQYKSIYAFVSFLIYFRTNYRLVFF